MLTGECVRELVNGLPHDFDGEPHSQAVVDEVEKCLHHLDRDAAVITGMDCRSRFSHNRTGQVQIRVRLKQVTGMVSR
jgi:hypothetical protein